MAPNSENGWLQWGKHVLEELKRLNTCYDNLLKENGKMRVEIAKLKVKSGIWGLAGGSIPVAIAIILKAMGKF